MDEATSGDNRVPYSITNNAKLNPLSLKSDHDPLLFVPSGRRTNRRQKRQWILTAFIGVLCVAVAATVIQAVYFSADLPSAITIPNVLLDSLPEWKISSNATLSSTSSPALAVIEDDDDNPLIKIFQAAGVNMEDLSEKNVANLPIVYREMKRMYGSNNMREPVVWGMHTCEEYRNKVPRERRYTATAGLFNTGTNAMEFHLRKNLQVSSRWQVPWGKHRVAAVRLKHTAPGMTKMNQEDALPIVMVRDPYHWMQSMVRIFGTALYLSIALIVV